ncbi:putative RNA methyltransferase [Bacillus massilinigeriensis]|uniref:putative RNA methyltransferase n=1 Tax=Bacillus massilionigeriensis TaxID=1805475 RepID=UPI00096AF20E|nr:methyltransferase domain-containing protein [Bacillus massilionigeriensis]
MTKKTKSAELLSEVISIFKCPFCETAMRVEDLKSLKCVNDHTFDIAKQGYINMMTHPSKTHYNKELFEARHKTIIDTHLYTPLHEAILKIIKEHMNDSISPLMIADLGCGEGSHLQRIVDNGKDLNVTGVGIDISKEGIVEAAKRYEDPIWIVGDLAKSPFEAEVFHVILNILSPSNYKEFKRILVQDGLIIKVVPRSNYLKELRENFVKSSENKVYKNDKIVTLFKSHFHLLDNFSLSYSQKLNKEQLINLVKMTPLSWSAEKEDIETFLHRGNSEITIDLEVLVGVNRK